MISFPICFELHVQRKAHIMPLLNFCYFFSVKKNLKSLLRLNNIDDFPRTTNYKINYKTNAYF